MGENPGLARAGAGDHQQWPTVVHDRIELIRVEPVQIECGSPRRGGMLVGLAHDGSILRMGCDDRVTTRR
jgi:hypothetical protein